MLRFFGGPLRIYCFGSTEMRNECNGRSSSDYFSLKDMEVFSLVKIKTL